MTSAGTPPPADSALIASPRHTAIVIAVVVGVAFLIARQASAPAATATDRSHVVQYLSMIAGEWLLVRLVMAGTRSRGISLRSLVTGGRPLTSALAGVAWRAAVVWVATFLGASGIADLIHLRDPAASHRTLAFVGPHGFVEIALWIVLAVSAGICEEIVFRGYLQRQLIALTRSTWAGVAIAAIVFGAGHAYQGWRACATIALYGVVLGIAARQFRDLRPGIVAHAAQDLVAGLFGH